MDKEAVDLKTMIYQTQAGYRKLSPVLRPPKKLRPITARTPQEATALARAVYYSVRDAEASGRFEKIEGGYKMSWKNENN